ncbi:hypothetical protein RDABS01_006168 [Bienertia sinuspersici]
MQRTQRFNLGPEGTFTFSATGGAGDHVYELKLDLCDKVNVEESKISYGPRSIVCILEKAESKWWNRLLREAGKPPHYVKVDWDKWADEDDDGGDGDGASAPADFDLGGMDFSKFGDLGGAGGEEFDESDDDGLFSYRFLDGHGCGVVDNDSPGELFAMATCLHSGYHSLISQTKRLLLEQEVSKPEEQDVEKAGASKADEKVEEAVTTEKTEASTA